MGITANVPSSSAVGGGITIGCAGVFALLAAAMLNGFEIRCSVNALVAERNTSKKVKWR
jgi:hypothetical protein